MVPYGIKNYKICSSEKIYTQANYFWLFASKLATAAKFDLQIIYSSHCGKVCGPGEGRGPQAFGQAGPDFDLSQATMVTHLLEKRQTRSPLMGGLLQKRSAKALRIGPGSFQRTCWTGSEDGQCIRLFP